VGTKARIIQLQCFLQKRGGVVNGRYRRIPYFVKANYAPSSLKEESIPVAMTARLFAESAEMGALI